MDKKQINIVNVNEVIKMDKKQINNKAKKIISEAKEIERLTKVEEKPVQVKSSGGCSSIEVDF